MALHESCCNYLVGFYGAFYNEGCIYLALEYMDGGSLDDICKVCPSSKIPDDMLSIITNQVLQGLYYLHKERHLGLIVENEKFIISS